MGTVPVPYSPVAGDDATQARVLTWADACAYLLGSATSGGSKRPLCVMRQTVAQSIPNATFAAITFDVEDVDYDNGHSTVTNTSRYTAATAGWHHIDYFAIFATSATQADRRAKLRLNGTTDVNGSLLDIPGVTIANESGINGSRLVYLNAGDYIELLVAQNTGGALNTAVSGADGCTMCIEWRSN